jgi:hypothetical protein
MAAVEQDSVGVGPAPLVSPSGHEQGLQAGSSEVVEQAKHELSARYGFQLDEAFEMLCALARSQRCSVEDFADSVVRSGGRLDGDIRGETPSPLVSIRGGSSLLPELLIEAPSAASAFVLAGSLANYRARATVEGGVWRVVVDRCSSFSDGVPGALSRASQWLAECGLATTRVTLNGETYLLDGSTDGVDR